MSVLELMAMVGTAYYVMVVVREDKRGREGGGGTDEEGQLGIGAVSG